MPTPTFFNLPAEKREALIAAAIEEFGSHPYAVASVSRIVARLGIAKGSIYQYFEDKRDFFLYLLDHAAAEQLRLLESFAPPASADSVVALLRWQMTASARVGAAAPALVRLIARAFSDDLPFLEEARQRVRDVGRAHLYSLVIRGQARGEIDASLDADVAAAVIAGALDGLRALVVSRLAPPPATPEEVVSQLMTPDLEPLYDDVLRILWRGLAPAGGSASDRQEEL